MSSAWRTIESVARNGWLEDVKDGAEIAHLAPEHLHQHAQVLHELVTFDTNGASAS